MQRQEGGVCVSHKVASLGKAHRQEERGLLMMERRLCLGRTKCGPGGGEKRRGGQAEDCH